MKLTAISTTGTKGTHTASDAVFGVSVNEQLLAQAIRVYQYNDHQSTSRVKTRGEVIRTKKKWFKQKGTGNARHAQRSAPIFVGGGVAHGPKGLSTANLKLSQTQKRQALRSALSLQHEAVIVSDGIETIKSKTADAHKAISFIVDNQPRTLIVISNRNDVVERAFANIPYVLVTTAEHVTALDVCAADTIVFSPEGVKALEERISDNKVVAQAAPKKVVKPVAKAEEKSSTTKTEKKTTAKKTTKKSTSTKK